MPVPRQIKLWLLGLYTVVESAIVGVLIGLFSNWDHPTWGSVAKTAAPVCGYAVFKYLQQSPFSKVLEDLITTETTVKKTEVTPSAVVETTVKKTEVVPAGTDDRK